MVFREGGGGGGPAGGRARAPGEPIPVVTYLPPSLTRDAALRTLDRAGLAHHIACTTKGQLGLRAAVLAGLGLAVHSESLLPADLYPVHGLPSPGTTEFVLISTARRAASAPERALTRAIVENIDRLRFPRR